MKLLMMMACLVGCSPRIVYIGNPGIIWSVASPPVRGIVEAIPPVDGAVDFSVFFQTDDYELIFSVPSPLMKYGEISVGTAPLTNNLYVLSKGVNCSRWEGTWSGKRAKDWFLAIDATCNETSTETRVHGVWEADPKVLLK